MTLVIKTEIANQWNCLGTIHTLTLTYDTLIWCINTHRTERMPSTYWILAQDHHHKDGYTTKSYQPKLSRLSFLPLSSASHYPLAPALVTCNTCHWSWLPFTCACQGEIIGTRLCLISELPEAVTQTLFTLLYYGYTVCVLVCVFTEI